jgi:hypothetical protein
MPGTQARIASSSGPTPMIAITRFMLLARTWRLMSVRYCQVASGGPVIGKLAALDVTL